MGTERIRSAVLLIQYAVLLLYALIWVQFGYVRERVGERLNLFYTLDVLALCYLAFRAYLVVVRRVSKTWDYVWLSADLVIISCMVYLTGGIHSEAALAYFWPIATSSIEHRPRRTAVAGLFSAVLYAGATWPAEFDMDHVARLSTRILILLLATILATCYAAAEAARVEEMARLRERVALADYRMRLSQEMHDGVQHFLVNISARLELARSLMTTDPARAARMAVDQRFAVRQAADELRDLVRLLRSPTVEREGFVDAARRLLSLFAERSSMSVPVEIQGDPTTMSPEVAHAAFRVLQEALTNVEKHAEAHQVKVGLRFSPDRFECVVADDGVGFEPSSAGERPEIEGGFGLSNMKQRAETVGGRLQVNSAPGQGTEITFSIPLEGCRAL